MDNNTQNGVATPTTNGTDTQNPVTNTSSVDYEQEYKKQALEIEKLKNAISKTNSENAEYKRKELEKMTDDEKKAKELQDLIDSKNQMEARLREFELKDSLFSNGFNAEESAELIKNNMSVETWAKIVKDRVDLAVKSAKAEGLKDSTPPAPNGNGITKGTEKTPFQKFQENKTKTENIVKL